MRSTDTMNPIYGENLSLAWAEALDKCRNAKGMVLSPGIVGFKVSHESPEASIECQGIRTALERFLASAKDPAMHNNPIETVAGTIFPESIWRLSKGTSERLYELYDQMWSRVKKCPLNNRGTYFRRLTAFGGDVERVNQLQIIIDTWRKNVHRLSALQAAIFDPSRDHIATRQLGFPCLQHVVFQPIGTNGDGGLSVVAFYANQLLIEKAYGNYLGLYRLGRFMAEQMGLRLSNVLCIAAALKLHVSKKGSDLLAFEVLRQVCNAKK